MHAKPSITFTFATIGDFDEEGFEVLAACDVDFVSFCNDYKAVVGNWQLHVSVQPSAFHSMMPRLWYQSQLVHLVLHQTWVSSPVYQPHINIKSG